MCSALTAGFFVVDFFVIFCDFVSQFLCAIYIRQIQVAEISEIISVSCYLHGRAIDRRSKGHGFESCVKLILVSCFCTKGGRPEASRMFVCFCHFLLFSGFYHNFVYVYIYNFWTQNN